MICIFVFIVGMVTFSTTVFADEGEFYDDVLEAFENENNPSEELQEQMESQLQDKHIDKYDYDTNTMNCSWYQVMCHVNGFIWTNMVGLVDGAITQIQSIITGFSDFDTSGDETVQNYKNAFQTLSITMSAIFLLYQSIRITMLYIGESDDGMNVMQEKLWKVLAIGILLGIYPQLYSWIMDLIQMTASSIVTTALETREVVMALAVHTALYAIVLGLFVAVILIVFAISYLYRFALFTLLFITGVIAIPTMLNDEFNFFTLWLRTIVSNGLTFILQTLCFALGFNMLTSFEDIAFMFAIAFFILALAVPGILNQFGASSGTGRAIGSGAKTVMRVASRR